MTGTIKVSPEKLLSHISRIFFTGQYNHLTYRRDDEPCSHNEQCREGEAASSYMTKVQEP